MDFFRGAIEQFQLYLWSFGEKIFSVLRNEKLIQVHLVPEQQPQGVHQGRSAHRGVLDREPESPERETEAAAEECRKKSDADDEEEQGQRRRRQRRRCWRQSR